MRDCCGICCIFLVKVTQVFPSPTPVLEILFRSALFRDACCTFFLGGNNIVFMSPFNKLERRLSFMYTEHLVKVEEWIGRIIVIMIHSGMKNRLRVTCSEP